MSGHDAFKKDYAQEPQSIDRLEFPDKLENQYEVIDLDSDIPRPNAIEEDIELISDDSNEEDEDEEDEIEDVEQYEEADVQPSSSNHAVVDDRIAGADKFHPATDHSYWLSRLAPIDPEYPVKESTHFTWQIPSFDTLTEQKYTSSNFTCGGVQFHILLFPLGNDSNSLALYLAPEPPTKKDPETGKDVAVDPDWYVCAQFGLMISNPDDANVRYFNQSSHRFNAEEPDWGFASFIEIAQLSTKSQVTPTNPKGNGFLNKEHRLNITAYVKVIQDTTGVLWHNFNNYDSKKETGFTGIKNQGATCYLNSLLQSYYFTRVFRKSVFQIPSEVNSGSNFTLALQRLFYYLQVNHDGVDTNELTRSFGWDAADSFTQHDVQELNRILMDRLEAKMKGTVVEDSLNKTFVGKMKSFIKCVNVDYESSRLEDLWDIQLNVKNLKNLNESFENYIAKEMLDGENKYDAGSYGLQDAEKGVVFEDLPNVLHLQLKRFDYDFMYDTLVKINDRHEFPEFIDLKPYLDKTNTAVMDQDWEYELYAVLIHSGDISSGHYYAMIKPDKDSGWFRFDDDKVLRVTRNEVFEDNYGHNRLPNSVLQKFTRAQYNEYQMKRHTSAYMLVYFRKSKLDEVLCDFDSSRDIPKHIRDTIEKERQEAIRKQKELEELHLYLKVHLYGGNSWFSYQGFDLGVNRLNGGLVNGKWNGHIYESPGELAVLENTNFSKQKEFTGSSNPPKLLKVLRQTPIKELYQDIVNTHLQLADPQTESKYIRLWILAHRKNETTRPDVPLGYSDAAKSDAWDISNIPQNITVEQVHERFSAKKNYGLYLWVEDTRNDLGNIYRFSKEHTSTLLPEIPRNFLQFPKLFNAIHELVNTKPESDNIFKPISINNSSAEILIFIKYFDIANQTLTGLSHLVVPKNSQIASIVPILNHIMGFSPDTSLALYEEIKPTTIELVKQSNNFMMSELQTGDILVFSANAAVSDASIEKFKDICEFDPLKNDALVTIKTGNTEQQISKNYIVANRDKLIDDVLIKSDDVPAFYKYMKSRIHIYLKPKQVEGSYAAICDPDALSTKKVLDFQFWVGPQTTYMDIAEALGAKLDIDPNVIRLFIVAYNDSGSIPLKKRYSVGLIIGKSFNFNSTLTLEYEILNITLDELENLKLVKISWLPSGVLHEHSLEFLLDKNSTINDLLDKFVDKLTKNHEKVLAKDKLLVWRTAQNRILKTYTPQDSVAGFPSKSVVYIRPLSEDEEADFNDLLYNAPGVSTDDPSNAIDAMENAKEKNLNRHIVEVIQFSKDPSRPHGIPFHFVVIKDETFADTKKRLQAKMSLGVKEFSKVQIGLINKVTNRDVRYCNKDEVVLFDELTTDDAIFLDLPDRTPHRSSYGNGAIVIKN